MTIIKNIKPTFAGRNDQPMFFLISRRKFNPLWGKVLSSKTSTKFQTQYTVHNLKLCAILKNGLND